MSNIIPFSFEGHEVRVTAHNDEAHWVLTDVCAVLEIGSPHKAATRLDEDEKGRTTIPTLGGLQEMTIINESGLWSLVLTSRKPEARRFKKWLTSKVLPTIRRTGSYNPASSEALTAQKTGGIVKGVVAKALRTEGPALVRAILAEQGFSLVEDYKTANGWLIEYKAHQKGRSGLTQRVGRTLRKLCEELGIPRHRCAVSGKWLYPSAVARPFFQGTGGHWVRMHNAAALGQSAIPFEDEAA